MKSDPQQSVFINCPFDAAYAPLFDAIIYRYVSDLSGFDPIRHDGTVEILIKRVMNWLGGRPNSTSSLYPRQVLAAFPGFQRRRQGLEAEWGEDVPWSHLVDAAEEMAPKIPG